METQLSKVYEALKSGQKLTALSVHQICGSLAPSTKISQVQRKYGVTVNKRKVTIGGKHLVEWSL